MKYIFLFLAFAIHAHELTVEQKVGQILLVHFEGETATDAAKNLIEEYFIGGFIYYNWANKLSSPAQVYELNASLQKLSKIPLFIAVDQEGGAISRFQSGFTSFPGNKALGMAKDPELSYKAALYSGEEMKAAGINLNLAPVIDVNSNPRNPVIGVRSFGDDPETVIEMGRKALSGYKQAGLMTAVKHYPGHGDVSFDSHESLPKVEKSLPDLIETDLAPFIALSSQSDMVLTGHIIVPALDDKNCATLSKPVLDYLRNELQFKGVIISDSLIMNGVLVNTPSIDEAAVQAFNAGCDIILLGGKLLSGSHANFELKPADIKRIHAHLVEAVKEGRISSARLDEAVSRILALKNRHDFSLSPYDQTQFNTAQHHALAKEIAEKSITIQKISKPSRDVIFIAPACLKDELSKIHSSHYFTDFNPSEKDQERLLALVNDSTEVVFFSYNSWKFPAQKDLIDKILTRTRLHLIAARDPLDGDLFESASTIIKTYDPTFYPLQAAIVKVID